MSISSDNHTVAVLRRLAEAVGCSVEAFTQPYPLEDATAGAYELLQLWAEIPDLQARQRLLAQARREAKRCRSRLIAAE